MTSRRPYVGDTTVFVCGHDADAGQIAAVGNEVEARAVGGEIVQVAVPAGLAGQGLPEDLVREVGLSSMWAYGRLDRLARSLARRSPIPERLLGSTSRAGFALALVVWLVRVRAVLPGVAIVDGPGAPRAPVAMASLLSSGLERVGPR